MESNSIISEVLSKDYKTRKFIDNWSRNRTVSYNSALNNGIKKDTVEVSKYCTDGKDDGKISVKEKIGNFAKGVIAPIENMFKSTKNFLKGLGAIALGAGLIYATGGAAAPVMVAAGIIGGGIKIGKNAHKAKNAKTDKDAKEAWQGIGTGTATVAVSVAGAKSALKVSGTEAATVAKMNPLKATVECFKKTGNYGKSIISGIKSHIPSSGKINPETKIKTDEATVTEAEIPVKKAEIPVKVEETISSEAPAKPVKTAEETVVELKEAVKKQTEAVEEAGSEIEDLTQKLLESTINGTKGIKGIYGKNTEFPQSPNKGFNVPKIFKRK